MTCDFCNREYILQDRFRTFGVGKTFCSLFCLRRYVESVEPLDERSDVFRYLDRIPPLAHHGVSDVYSSLLGQTFRSHFEQDMCELMVLSWNWKVEYEPFSCQTGTSKSSSYVPDFYVPDHGVWLENKGDWRLGARKKFEKTQRILTDKRLVLIGPQYFGELKRLAKEVRQRYGMGA